MDGWVNKMWYTYNGILFILKKEGRTVTRYDIVNSEDIMLGNTVCFYLQEVFSYHNHGQKVKWLPGVGGNK